MNVGESPDEKLICNKWWPYASTSTIDRVSYSLLLLGPLSISFIGNTPSVAGINDVTVEISLSRQTRFATCRLGDTVVEDCKFIMRSEGCVYI